MSKLLHILPGKELAFTDVIVAPHHNHVAFKSRLVTFRPVRRRLYRGPTFHRAGMAWFLEVTVRLPAKKGQRVVKSEVEFDKVEHALRRMFPYDGELMLLASKSPTTWTQSSFYTLRLRGTEAVWAVFKDSLLEAGKV